MPSQRSFRPTALVDSVRAQLARREAVRAGATAVRPAPAVVTAVARATTARAAVTARAPDPQG